jgi:hypothetical protein
MCRYSGRLPSFFPTHVKKFDCERSILGSGHVLNCAPKLYIVIFGERRVFQTSDSGFDGSFVKGHRGIKFGARARRCMLAPARPSSRADNGTKRCLLPTSAPGCIFNAVFSHHVARVAAFIMPPPASAKRFRYYVYGSKDTFKQLGRKMRRPLFDLWLDKTHKSASVVVWKVVENNFYFLCSFCV